MSDIERLERLCVACLQEGLDVHIRATGHSMKPTICDGALIRVRAMDPADLRSGDIILYRKANCVGSGIIAHRVVALIRRHRRLVGFVTRGDASSTCDAPVDPSRVLGKIVAVEGRAVERMAGKRKLMAQWQTLLRCFKCRNFLK